MIKKFLRNAFFVLLFIVFLTSSASALTQDEWIRKYGRRKIIQTVDVYNHRGAYITTLKAGTYVQVTSDLHNGTMTVYTMTADGTKVGGYVSSDAVGSGCVHYLTPNGESHAPQELNFYDMVRNGEIDPSVLNFHYVSEYLNDVYNTPWASGKTEPTDTPESTSAPAATKKPSSAVTKAPSTRKPSSSSSSKKTVAPRVTATPAPVKSTVTYQGLAAQIDVLSSYESQITVGGKKLTVLTSELEFESTAKETERLAVIYAPKTGKATLRAKASQSAAMVKNCKAGRYALVLEKGKNFSKIYYNNAVGYIRTDCLKFHPIAADPWPEGILSLNGYTTGNAEINIRNKADYGTHISGTYKTGTVIRVIEIGDTWTEVEIDRIRGYIQTKFLTMPE